MKPHENFQEIIELEKQPIFLPDHDLYKSYFENSEESTKSNKEKNHVTDDFDNYGDLVLFI